MPISSMPFLARRYRNEDSNFVGLPVFKIVPVLYIFTNTIDNAERAMLKKFFLASTILLSALAASAQEAPPDNSAPPAPAARGAMPPCLRAAGISMSEFDQLRSIAQEARAQVQEACTNTSLTAQQKRQQVEDIHQQSHGKMAEIVTPDQRRAFMACRARHGDRRPVDWYERPGGGCGGAGQRRGQANNAPESAPEENGPAETAPPARNSSPQGGEPSSPKNDSAPPKDDSSPQ